MTNAFNSGQGESTVPRTTVKHLLTNARVHLNRSGFALADQVVVGGLNFLTMVLVGRIAGVHELGLFALGFTIVLVAVVLHESIVTTPATILVPKLDRDQRRLYFGSALVMQIALSAAVAAVLLAAAGASYLLQADASVSIGLAVLAAVIPCWCLREFARRLALAELNAKSVLALDSCIAVIAGFALGMLILTGQLAATSAFAVTGAAMALPTIGWLLVCRNKFLVQLSDFGPSLQRNWVAGKWILIGQSTTMATGEAMPWVLVATLGTEATGIFAACRAIFRVVNPVVVTVSNLLTPYAAHAFADGGRQSVNFVVKRTVVGLGLLMAAFFVFILLFGGHVLTLCFGPEYAAYHGVLTILAAAQMAMLLGMGPGRGLLVIGRPQLGVVAEALGCLVVVGASVPLIGVWNLHGAAASFLMGTALTSGLALYFYHWVCGSRGLDEQRHRDAATEEMPPLNGARVDAISAPACLEGIE